MGFVRWLNQRRNVMAGNVTTAKNDALEARELSPEEIDAVSGAWIRRALRLHSNGQ